MSMIRRHGVAFHLLPTPSDGLWLEVIRESDGVVLVTQEYEGQGDGDFAAVVDEWFDELVFVRLKEIDIPVCRLCGARRRTIRQNDDGWILTDYLVEWEFDLCLPCASNMEEAAPWIRQYLRERYQPASGDDDDW